MKSTDFIVESIGEDADHMAMDHEVQMARSDCYHAAKYAIELHKILHKVSEQQGLDGWVSEKITLANDYLRTVWEHLSHDQAMGQEQELSLPAFTFEGAEDALQNNLGETHYHDDDEDCEVCSGTGEGRWEGQSCSACHGTGVQASTGSDDDFDLDDNSDPLEDEPESHYEKHVRVHGLGEEGKGLWANIHAKQERIKHGSHERMRKPGSKGAPSAQDFKDSMSEGEVVKLPSKKPEADDVGIVRRIPKKQTTITEPTNKVTPIRKKNTVTAPSMHSIYEGDDEELFGYSDKAELYQAVRGMRRGGEITGTSANGYIRASYDQLVNVFGEPMFGPSDESDDDKISCEWVITFGDKSRTVATIYDWKTYSGTPMEEYDWHVGGKHGSRASEFVEAAVKFKGQQGVAEGCSIENKLRNKLAEMTAGGTGAGGFATGPAGGGFKKTTGVPKKVKNVIKRTKPQVGKGIY